MPLGRPHPLFLTSVAGLLIALAPVIAVAHGPLHEQIERVSTQIKANPHDASLYLRRGELYRMNGHTGDAQADCRRARELGAATRDVAMSLARVHRDEGCPDESLALLDDLLEAHPDDVDALWLRAEVLAELGRPLRAADDMDLALTLAESPRPGQYIRRARLLAGAVEGPAVDGQALERAIVGLDAGMMRLGPVVSLQWLAIELEQKRDRWDRALERIDVIAEQYARREHVYLRRAEILEACGRPLDAMVAYTNALDALDALPAARRSTRMARELETAARRGLERLEVGLAKESK